MTQAETWIPSCCVEEAHEILTRSDNLLEIEVGEFNGRQLKVWKNQPPSMREFFLHVTEDYKNKTYVVYGEERYSFQEILRSSIKSLAKCTVLVLDPERADMVQPIASELKQTTEISAYVVFNDQAAGFRWVGMDAWTRVCSEDHGGTEDILNNDPNVLPDDDAAIFFTSGTTGLPKAVLTSHRACLTAPFNDSFLESRERLRQGEPIQFGYMQNSDVQGGILLPRIMCHIGPFASMMTCTDRGLKLVITRTWDPPEVTRLCKAESITKIAAVAIVIRELADNGLAGYPLLESVVFTGSTIPPSFFQSVRKAFPQTRVQQVYGMTETTGAVGGFAGRDYEARPESCGFMYPTNDVRIMKDGDNEAVLDEEGEIWVRGPSIMKGYFGDPVATDKVLTQDGWYKTGDLGNLDAQGYLCIKGRIKDIVICGGSNIDAVWVENVLYSVPGVSEAALVGIPDELMDELAAALVTVRPEYKGTVTEEYLLAKAEELLPKYAVPVMIIVLDGKFERNTSGKILKNKLRITQLEWWGHRNIAQYDWQFSGRLKHSLHGKNPGEYVDLIFKKQITHFQQENDAPTGYGSSEATLPLLIERQTVTTRAMREAPPSDPAAFDAWIVALFVRNIDTVDGHPQWLYARRRAPRHIPPTDPAAFDAWITSFFTCSKANRTHHRDTVHDELPQSITVDTQSGSPSESATVKAGPSHPQPGLPWWIVPASIPLLIHIPKPVVATTVPRWLGTGSLSVMFMSRAHMSESGSEVKRASFNFFSE
ncbi:hypothetical protein IW261DRAFT_1574120 [Armillaria novae-zelandiae]|uniref:Acetyl-CoA synthetase-like protein n=1 Tax=Armillaria novae-zelandiae TaxID=153914 RepID=A0AA39NKS3_9AGAR|nr:hypothetical protein IW261DRAFT_1574120 [Armillaria novae-zelandiae]